MVEIALIPAESSIKRHPLFLNFLAFRLIPLIHRHRSRSGGFFTKLPRSAVIEHKYRALPFYKSSWIYDQSVHTSETTPFKMSLSLATSRAPQGGGSFPQSLDVRTFPFKSDPSPNSSEF